MVTESSIILNSSELSKSHSHTRNDKSSKYLIISVFSIIFCLVFLLQLASAQEFYRQDSPIDIRHSVRNSGGITSTALCNLTVFSPNKTILVPFQRMSFSSTTQTYNYTLPPSNTSQLGEYCYDVTCTDSGLNQTDSFCFEVNPIGQENSIAENLIYILLLVLIAVLFCVCCYYGYTLPFRNERNESDEVISVNWKKYLKMFCIGMAYVFFVWGIYVSWNLAYAYLDLRNFYELFKLVFIVLLALSLPVFILGVVFAIRGVFSDKNIQDQLNRGLPVS